MIMADGTRVSKIYFIHLAQIEDFTFSHIFTSLPGIPPHTTNAYKLTGLLSRREGQRSPKPSGKKVRRSHNLPTGLKLYKKPVRLRFLGFLQVSRARTNQSVLF